MNIWNTLYKWGKDAWGLIFGLPADVGKAISAVWHYITSVHNVLSWLTSIPLVRAFLAFLYNISVFHGLAVAVEFALRRIAGWIWLTMVKPVRDWLNHRINVLAAWTARQLFLLHALVVRLYLASLAYTRRLVGIERAQRIAAIRKEHAEMLAAVAAAIALIQRQAASGYNAGLHARLSIVARLLNDLADRSPIVKDAVGLLVKAVFDLETVDDPLLRFAISKLLGEIVSKLGVDKATGDLINRLLGPLAGQAKAKGLHDVAKDASDRLTALEGQWADFMTAGGPEVEQAGREWKGITEVGTDVAVLAVFGLAVADPQLWARGVADTIGVAGNDALIGIIDLIKRA